MAADAPKRDVVLFLGAGFSAHAQLQTMKGFGQHLRESYDPFCGQEGYEALCKVLTPAKWISLAFIEWCGSDDMEKVFRKAQNFKEKKGVDLVKGVLLTPQAIVDALVIRYWKMLQECAPSTAKRSWLCQPYCAFLGQIMGAGLHKRLTVITTNVDLLFEYFAKNLKMPIGLPFKDGRGCRMLSAARRRHSFLSYRRGHTLLCKLHGSINFFRRPNGPLLVDDRWSPKSSHPTVFDLKPLNKLWKKHDGKLVPQVWPPTGGEPPERTCFIKARERAEEALRNAKAIVFIGYGLRDCDKHIMKMIKDAVRERAPKIWVVDKCIATLTRYGELFPQLKGTDRLVQKEFAQAVDEDVFTRIFDEIKEIA